MESKETNNEHLSYDLSRREFLRVGGLTLMGAFIPRDLKKLSNEIECNDVEEDILRDVSYSYIANTPKDAEEVAKCVRTDRSASASNVCGPLAISMLLGWKLNRDGSVQSSVNNEMNDIRVEGISPNDMWLGSPATDLSRYNMAFPKEEYDSYRISESMGTADFDNLPDIGKLKVGDFMYLDGGSFTHYLAITRKDSKGRLYSVTNIQGEKPGEFLIKEVMVWDPSKKDGFFRKWTEGVGPEGATTGRQGFYMWRRKEKASYLAEDAVSKEKRESLTNSIREDKDAKWNMYTYEFGKGEIFEWRNKVPYRSYEIVSLPIAVIAMEKIRSMYSEEIRNNGLEYVLNMNGFEGKRLNTLLTEVLTTNYSDSRKSVYRFCNMEKGLESLGMSNTNVESSTTTQRDMFKLFNNIFSRKILDEESMKYIFSKLEIKGSGLREWKVGSANQFCSIVEIPKGKDTTYMYIGVSALDRNPENEKVIRSGEKVKIIKDKLVTQN